MYFIDSLHYFISNIFTANITNTPNLSKRHLRKDERMCDNNPRNKFSVKQLTKTKTLIQVFYNDYIAIILMIKFVTEMLTQLLTTYAKNALARGNETVTRPHTMLKSSAHCIAFR